MSCYVVSHLAEYWREDGFKVIFLFGVREQVSADLLFVHVDLSVVPDRYLEFARRHGATVNAEVKDIRKSSFSRNLVRPGDAYDGPVIVKSDLNCAGAPERFHRPSILLNRLLSRKPTFEESTDYRVYDRLGDVPEVFFKNPEIVVEKFLPEIEGDMYFVRAYHFLGDHEHCTRHASKHPIVKAGNEISNETVEPHPEIVEARRRLKFDYGKFDYVVRDGKAELLDINKTTGSVTVASPELEARRRFRAQGIHSFFR